jgi:hypothetical protein
MAREKSNLCLKSLAEVARKQIQKRYGVDPEDNL